jgi:hypothetical protein
MPYAAFHPDTIVLTKPRPEDLHALAAKKPPSVTVFEYPFSSMEPLGLLDGIEVLKIQDTGALTTLHGIERLISLKNVVISTPPTWDGTNKKVEVDSFKPLTALKHLERLILLSVRPRDLDLSPIEQMTHLKELDIGGVPEFTIAHYARLAVALPNTEGRCLQPYIVIKGVGFCKKCNGQQVMLIGTAPKARKWLCPSCNKKKIDEHVAKWEACKRSIPGQGQA